MSRAASMPGPAADAARRACARWSRWRPRTCRRPATARAADGELWKLWYTSVPRPDSCRGLRRRRAGRGRRRATSLPFVVRDARSGEIVGTTRYCHVEPTAAALEIGYTWYAHARAAHRRSTPKPSCCCSAMRSRRSAAIASSSAPAGSTSARARPSRAWARSRTACCATTCAMPDGSLRDTVVFSIIDREWPAVKRNLTTGSDAAAAWREVAIGIVGARGYVGAS